MRSSKTTCRYCTRNHCIRAPHIGEVVTSIDQIRRLCGDLFVAQTESMRIFCMDHELRFLNYFDVALGGRTEMTLFPSRIFRHAIETGARYICIAHNHTSGSELPSVWDITTTDQLINVGQVVGIEIIDHVIVTSTGINSMAEAGRHAFALPGWRKAS